MATREFSGICHLKGIVLASYLHLLSSYDNLRNLRNMRPAAQLFVTIARGVFFFFLFLPAQVYVTSICFCMHQFVCNNMQKQWSHCDQSGPRPSFLVQLAITVSVSLQLLCASTCLKLSYGRVALSGLVHQGSSGATRKRTYHISI